MAGEFVWMKNNPGVDIYDKNENQYQNPILDNK